MKVPLIKENNIAMLIKSMHCIDKHAYDREAQRECILSLYPNKSEKSVFRGMVIPSLRHLGFIVGYSDLIRLSANGKLLLQTREQGDSEFLRVLSAVFLEIDSHKFKFIQEIQRLESVEGVVAHDHLLRVLCQKVEAPSQKQKKERVTRWLKMLEQCGLLKKEKDPISIRLLYSRFKKAENDLNWQPKLSLFKRLLFESYLSLFGKSAGIVDIADVREYVALSSYRERKKVLTEHRFDELLNSLPLVTDDYVISLGHPMGAEEKLFVYKGDYYRTLSITFFKERAKHG